LGYYIQESFSRESVFFSLFFLHGNLPATILFRRLRKQRYRQDFKKLS